jgi:hypothetical protein
VAGGLGLAGADGHDARSVAAQGADGQAGGSMAGLLVWIVIAIACLVPAYPA